MSDEVTGTACSKNITWKKLVEHAFVHREAVIRKDGSSRRSAQKIIEVGLAEKLETSLSNDIRGNVE